MLFLSDLPPAQVQQTVTANPMQAAQSAPPPPAAKVAGAAQPVLPRQEVDSHGYHYIIVGNRLLPRAELAAVVTAGKTPVAVVGGLKKAYEGKGYFLVVLVGKQQQKEVWLQVVQGKLTHVDGPAHMAKFFTGLKGNDEVRNSDVIRRSILAQAYAATNGQQPQISFKPAPEVGGSSMVIDEKPLPGAQMFGGSLTAGNFGNRYAGHYLAQAQASAQYNGWSLQVNHSRALTGMDDNTRGAYYAATSATLTAITPLGTFAFDNSATKYQLGKAFAPLYPAGRIKKFGLTATQLAYADDLHRWSFNEALHHIRDTGTVFNNSFTLRDQKYNVLEVGSDYSWRFAGWSARPASLSLSGGLKYGGARGEGGFSHATGAPDGHFAVYAASAGLTQTLPADYSVQFNLSGQSSPDILPSYQQWVLGGLNNLTAWLPGTVVGDRGYLGRLTMQGPQWRVGPLQLRPSVFAEHGAARYSFITRGSPTWQSLTDAGASLALSWPQAHTSAILAYAQPLAARDVESKLRRGQQAHVFFYLQTAF